MSEMTRLYGALATAPEGASVHYIYQTSEHILIDKTFTQDWSLPEIIGPAQAGTAAACCFDESTTPPSGVIVSVNPSGILQDHIYDAEEEWLDGTLSSLRIRPYSGSKLAMVLSGGAIRLYFQADSAITEATYSGSEWALGSELPAAARAGGALSAVVGKGEVRVSYVHVDGTLHQCVYADGRWKDSSIGATIDGAAPATLYANDQGAGVSYSTAAGDVVAVMADGTHEKIGTIDAEGVVQGLGGKENGFDKSYGVSASWGSSDHKGGGHKTSYGH